MIFFSCWATFIQIFFGKIHNIVTTTVTNSTNVEPVSYIYIIKPTGCQNNPGRVFPLDASASIPVLVSTWDADIRDLDKNPILRFSNKIKHSFGMENYLFGVKNDKYRTALAKLRSSSHTLAIETGRHSRSKLKVHERLCQVCQCIEDETHLMIGCEINTDERSHLFTRVTRVYPAFECLPNVEKCRFLPEASFGLRVLSSPASVCVCVRVCVCVSLCVNHLLVRAITRDPFKLGSPNLDQRCKRPWLRSLLFLGVIDHDLQGQI